MTTLTPKEISDLRRFCEWLNTVPRKSVYPGTMSLAARLHKIESPPEDITYWLSNAYREKRKYADAIFWSGGWGGRLRKHWRERLDQIEAELTPNPNDVGLEG